MCGRLKVSWKWDIGGTCCVVLLLCTQSTHTTMSTLMQEPEHNKSPSHKTELKAQKRNRTSDIILTRELGEQRSEADVFVFCGTKGQLKKFAVFFSSSSFLQNLRDLLSLSFLCNNSVGNLPLNLQIVGMKEPEMAKLPMNSPHHLPTMPQHFCRCVRGTSSPSTQHYI